MCFWYKFMLMILSLGPPTQRLKNLKEAFYQQRKICKRSVEDTPSLGLQYPKRSGLDLKGYRDSVYVGCNMDRKSTSDACQLLEGKLVSEVQISSNM
ncbi:hypothetical protein Tco_0408915 [Tanacetum coccineum]